MEEKVDILLTTYKTDIKYLRKQVDSILNQTYKNITLIISDDNSCDEKLIKELKEYEQKDKRIKLFLSKENLGYIKNFEFLLKQSEAQFIMFSDHDDIWYENKLEKSLEKLKKENVDLVYCNAKQINQDDEVIQENYFKYKNMPKVKGKNNILAISRYLGIGCSQIFTKQVKEKMLPFTDKVMAHDWLASFVANESKGVAYIEEPLFEYRLHTNNVFGGRNLSQNLARWKEKNGNSYKSFLKYRKENVIYKAYLSGVEMCLQYSKNDKNKQLIKEMIEYYKKLEKSKYINIHIIKYFKYLSGKNLFKKEIKEILNFHFPIIGYLIFITF